MRKYILVLPLVLCSIAVLAGCQNAPERVALNANRLMWQAHNVYHYQYTLRVSCFCPREITDPVVIEVKNGVPVSVGSSETAVSKADFFDDFDTIDELFLIVDEAIDQDPARLDVTYDEEFGFPSNVYIDYDFQIADEELGFTVSDFKELTP